MLKVTIELVPQGNEAEKRGLYSVEISNTNVDMTGNFGQYLATMSGEEIDGEKPLAIKLRKFNRDQGAAKLTSRILSRFFRKYKTLLSDPSEAPVEPAPEVPVAVAAPSTPAETPPTPAQSAIAAPLTPNVQNESQSVITPTLVPPTPEAPPVAIMQPANDPIHGIAKILSISRLTGNIISQ